MQKFSTKKIKIKIQRIFWVKGQEEYFGISSGIFLFGGAKIEFQSHQNTTVYMPPFLWIIGLT